MGNAVSWREDLRYDYPLTRDSVVVDVGGYHGDFTYGIVKRFQCRVIVIEPVVRFCSHMMARFEHEPLVTIKQCALTGPPYGMAEIQISGNCSSFDVGDRPVIGRDMVERCDPAAMFSMDESFDLLKINIEGGEYELIDRLVATGLISRFRFVQVQTHCAPDQEFLVTRMRSLLSKTHEYSWVFNNVRWESWERR